MNALALFVEEDRGGSPYGWVTASNEGAPERIGRTTGGGRPGVATWGGRGYVIGFGEASGDVRLAVVSLPDAPPAYDRTGTPESRVGRETAALTISDIGTISAGGADDVAISIGSARAGGIDVGVAWREGCGSGAEPIHFRQVFVTNDGAIEEARDRGPWHPQLVDESQKRTVADANLAAPRPIPGHGGAGPASRSSGGAAMAGKRDEDIIRCSRRKRGRPPLAGPLAGELGDDDEPGCGCLGVGCAGLFLSVCGFLMWAITEFPVAKMLWDGVNALSTVEKLLGLVASAVTAISTWLAARRN